MEKNKLSVVIPIYKVELFVERCVHSLFRQTYKEVEYIFVDDHSPDRSMEIIKNCIAEYPHLNTILLEHSINKGLPAARNTGLSVATGKYVFHCDSDDFVEPDMLEKLYRRAEKTDADIVWCDWFLSFEKNERYMKQPDYSSASEALKGMLAGTMKYNVWNKLVKRSLYTENHIQFPEGYGMGEDMTMIRLFACAEKVAYVPQAFYHYVKLNTQAFTNTFSERHLEDIRYNVDETIEFLRERFGNTLDDYLSYFKLNVKYPFLISNEISMYQLWNVWYPEANEVIGRNPYFSGRSKMLQYAAKYRMYGVLWLYYWMIHRLVYGVIYK